MDSKIIDVFDENGEYYGKTYKKRALGLVKKGRARFRDETSVLLACPPVISKKEIIEMTDTEKTAETEINNTPAKEFIVSAEYILNKIEKIAQDNAHINTALSNLSLMADGANGDCGSPGNLLGQAKAQAIADVVKCRETTNRQLLSFYEKLYDDSKHLCQPDSEQLTQGVSKLLASLGVYLEKRWDYEGETEESAENTVDCIRHIVCSLKERMN